MGGRSGGGGRSSSRSSNSSRSSGSISSFFSSNKPSNYSYSSPRTPITAPTTHIVKVEQPGFFSNVMQGFGLGAGQSMAFNLFKPFQSSSSTASNNTVPAAAPEVPAASVKELPKEYVQCMKEYDNKKDLCKQYLEDDN